MLSETRHAYRRLRATPLVTISAISCLAIGVWMTCILAALGRGFFRPDLHAPNPGRIVQLEARGLFTLNSRSVMCCGRMTSPAVIASLRDNPIFAAVGEYSSGAAVRRTSLSSGMMSVLGVRPYLGRVLLPSDDTTGDVVMLSYQVWRSRYGADSTIIGRHIYLDRKRAVTVVGVTRPEFVFPMNDYRPDFYTPMVWTPGRPRYPAAQMLGRLADGVRIDSARAVVRLLVARNARADRDAVTAYWKAIRPKWNAPTLPSGGVDVRLERYYNEPIDAEFLRLMVLVLACGFAVIAIATANVTNLLLVRGAARRQEIAVRMALGAARHRVIRELLLETSLLAAVGIVIGYAAAAWQWSLLDPGYAGRHVFGEVDAGVALIAVAAGLALTAAVGIWPGVRATSMSLEQVLRDARRSGVTSSPLDGVLNRMVAASTAATVMLLINGVLLTLSARDSMKRAGLGIQDLFTAGLSFGDEAPDKRLAAAKDALTRLRGLSGVTAAALGSSPENATRSLVYLSAAGQPDTRSDRVDVHTVSDGYFRTFRIPLLYGREFLSRETRDPSSSVVLSRTLAGRLFPTVNAVGQRVHFRRGEDSTRLELTVVGVAENAAGGQSWALYLPFGASVPTQTSIFIQVLKGARPDIMTALRSVTVTSATTVFFAPKGGSNNSIRRYLGPGFNMFAGVALILAAVGTYGVVSYSVVRRTHEIGVRMALGAERRRVMWMIIEQSLKVSLIGVIGGLLLSFVVGKVIGAFVQDVNMEYPIAIGSAIVFVSVVSFFASAIPGFRAGRLNPVDALRAE